MKAEKNQTRNDLPLPDGGVGRHGNPSTHIESHLSLVEWLHGLEDSDNLLVLEAKTSRNISWCKGVLFRWKEAGYPAPESWPEIQQSACLHPSYSLNHNDWPNRQKILFNRLQSGLITLFKMMRNIITVKKISKIAASTRSKISPNLISLFFI